MKTFHAFSVVLVSVLAVACSGDDGKVSLVRVENEAAGDNCATGGYLILSGIDDNENGTLDDGEVDGSSFACNGGDGSEGGEGSQGARCDLRPHGVCRNADLRGIVVHLTPSLIGVDLSGSDLTGATVSQATLTGANLTGAKLDYALIVESTLASANLTNVSLKGAFISGDVSFEGATLTGADFSGAFINESYFADAHAQNAKFVGARFSDFDSESLLRTDLTGADFTDLQTSGTVHFISTNLTNAVFTGANLADAQFSAGADTDAILTGAKLDFATLFNTNLNAATASAATYANAFMDSETLTTVGLDLTTKGALNLSAGSDFSNKDLSRCWFQGFDLSGYNLSGARLVKARLAAVDLGLANLTNADLTDASLGNAALPGTNFQGATMIGVVLTNVQVNTSTSFSSANLTGANLTGSDFTTGNFAGANLTRATIRNSLLAGIAGTPTITNVYYSSTTTFPDGLDPVAAGGTSIDDDAETNVAGKDLSGIWLSTNLKVAGTGANFTGAHLSGTRFNDSVLVNANFSNAQMQGTRILDSDVTGANFTNVKGEFMSWYGSSFANVNFTGASLYCAAAGRGDTGRTDVTGATWSSTLCPDGTTSNDNAPGTCGGHLFEPSDSGGASGGACYAAL